MYSDHVIESQLGPERIEERFDRLITLADEEAEEEDGLQLRKCQSVEAEFLEATRPRPIAVNGLTRGLYMQPVANREAILSFGLPNLPPNILLEVASYVYPLDLIHLSRSSKPLRRRLMSKTSRPIWRAVLSHTVVGLPSCPPDMCEPLYAALVFDHNCFACGIDGAFCVDYALKLRMCEQCYMGYTVEGREVLQSLPKDYQGVIGDIVFMLLPSANTFDLSNPIESVHRVIPLSHLMQDFYFKPELEAILGFFWPLPMPEDMKELKSLIRDRVSYVAERQARAVLNHSWDRVMSAAPEHAKALDDYFNVKAEFEPALDIVPPEYDWNKALSTFSDYLAAAHSAPLSSLPKSRAQLAAEQLALAQREDAARASRIRGRYAEVAEWYADILDDHLNYGEYAHDAMPNAHDGARLWTGLVLEDDARAPLDVDSVMGESKMEDAIWALRDYPRDAMRCLAQTVERWDAGAGAQSATTGKRQGNLKGRKGKGVYEGPKDIVLRATSLFRCAECGDCPHGWPEINAHWREQHPDESVWITSSRGREEYKAGVWEEGVDVAQRVLAVLVEQGLGKRDRNKTRLDEMIKERRIFCACGDPTMATPDHGLNWAALVNHAFIHLEENARRTVAPLQTAGADAVVWTNDHDLESCIKLLPRAGADLSQATYRFAADPDSRARVSTLFAQCPVESRPVCILCDELTPEDKKDSTLFLPECANAVLHHMQAKHGKCFQEQDVVFVPEAYFHSGPAL